MYEDIKDPITKKTTRFFAGDPEFFNKIDNMIHNCLMLATNDVDLFLLLRFKFNEFIDKYL